MPRDLLLKEILPLIGVRRALGICQYLDALEETALSFLVCDI
jgi:hypothetical protein